MSEVSAKDIPVEQQFMSEYWKFRKKYYNPENSDSYWGEVCAAADELYKKYDKNEYFKTIIMACLDDLDRRYRRMKSE